MPGSFWHIDIGNVLSIVCIAGPLMYGIAKIYTILNDYTPHKHTERSGHQLNADGISYPRSMRHGE